MAIPHALSADIWTLCSPGCRQPRKTSSRLFREQDDSLDFVGLLEFCIQPGGYATPPSGRSGQLSLRVSDDHARQRADKPGKAFPDFFGTRE